MNRRVVAPATTTPRPDAPAAIGTLNSSSRTDGTPVSLPLLWLPGRAAPSSEDARLDRQHGLGLRDRRRLGHKPLQRRQGRGCEPDAVAGAGSRQEGRSGQFRLSQPDPNRHDGRECSRGWRRFRFQRSAVIGLVTASVVAIFQGGHRNLDQPPTVLMFIMRAGECRRSGDTDGCKIHISSKPKTDVPSNSQDIATPASRAPQASRARRFRR